MDPRFVVRRSRYLPRRRLGVPVVALFAVAVAVAVAAALTPVVVAQARDIAAPTCRTIHLVVDTRGAPEGAFTDVVDAAARMHTATGADIVVDGLATDRQSAGRVLVAWSGLPHSEQHPHLVGWTNVVEEETGLSGSVRFDPALRMPSGFATRASWGGGLLHEFGHMLGMQHTADPADIMFGQVTTGPLAWGPGDTAQFAAVARRWGCSQRQR